MKQHNGIIEISSDEEPKKDDRDHKTSCCKKDKKKIMKKILIVDDDAEVRAKLSEILEAGYYLPMKRHPAEAAKEARFRRIRYFAPRFNDAENERHGYPRRA